MQFLVLVLILVSMAPKAQSADRYWLLNPPSKLVSCELTLKGAHRDLSQKESILPILRDVKYRILETIPQSKSDGIHYDDLNFRDSLNQLGKRDAIAIVQRLNGIEEDLTKTNLDAQFFVSEIRGANIPIALERMEAQETLILESYKQAKKDFYERFMKGKGTQFVFSFLSGATVFFAGLSPALTLDALVWSDYENLSLGTQMIMLAGSYAGLGSIRDYIAVNKQRLNPNYFHLKSALKKVSESPTETDFFMSSLGFSVPIEFHRHLLATSDQPLSEEQVQKARVMVVGSIEAGEISLWEMLKIDRSKFREELLKRIVNEARDVTRRGYIDHIVYFDKDAQEPVWLSFYRAYRTKPTGRKPSKKIFQREAKTKWSPGMVPTT